MQEFENSEGGWDTLYTEMTNGIHMGQGGGNSNNYVERTLRVPMYIPSYLVRSSFSELFLCNIENPGMAWVRD